MYFFILFFYHLISGVLIVIPEHLLGSFLHFAGVLSVIWHYIPNKCLVVSALQLLEYFMHFSVFSVIYLRLFLKVVRGVTPRIFFFNSTCILKNFISYLSSFCKRQFLNGVLNLIPTPSDHATVRDIFCEKNLTKKLYLAIFKIYCRGHDQDN